MKRSVKSIIAFLFILSIFSSIENRANATVITVSNNPVDSASAMYSNLQAAIDAASPGDTIYVSGSPTGYGNISIYKQLTLIGAGYNSNNQFGYKSELHDVTLRGVGLPSPSNSSGTFITGFRMLSIQDVVEYSIDNITITRNSIGNIWINSQSANHDSGWNIINNIITTAYSPYIRGTSYVYNTLIANNIFNGSSIIDFSQVSVLINNNLFLNRSEAISNLSNLIIANNIFFGAGVGSSASNADYCIFNNNISYGGSTTSFSYGTNVSAGNIENTSPEFVSVSGAAFNFSYDYHLQGASPGINAGTDGTDIGIYGSTYPFPSGGDVPWQTSSLPPIPQIMQMDVLNSVLPADSTLRIRVKARKQK
jgi:hypothetical protein